MSLIGKAKKAAAIGSAAATAWSIFVKVEGAPVRDRGKIGERASVRIAFIPIFTKTAEGKRTVFGFRLKDLK